MKIMAYTTKSGHRFIFDNESNKIIADVKRIQGYYDDDDPPELGLEEVSEWILILEEFKDLLQKKVQSDFIPKLNGELLIRDESSEVTGKGGQEQE